jgi:hypothetical protein
MCVGIPLSDKTIPASGQRSAATDAPTANHFCHIFAAAGRPILCKCRAFGCVAAAFWSLNQAIVLVTIAGIGVK